jgi:hypothetical protein
MMPVADIYKDTHRQRCKTKQTVVRRPMEHRGPRVSDHEFKTKSKQTKRKTNHIVKGHFSNTYTHPQNHGIENSKSWHSKSPKAFNSKTEQKMSGVAGAYDDV